MPYTLLYTDIPILIYFCRPLYSLLYTLLYTTQPRIFYTTLIYSIIYSLFYMPIIFLYILSTLLYTLMALLILPRRFTPLSYTPSLSLLSLIYLPLLFSYSFYCYIHSLIYKGYNYTAADFYTLYISILIFTTTLILHTLISQLSYYITFKEWKRRRQEL